MKVGFTGTRVGMSEHQKRVLRRELELVGATELHHGDCVGADAEADAIARELGIHVVVHPPSNSTKRAFCYRRGDGLWSTDSYANRNAQIVNATDRLIAGPRTNDEELRSGTWSTVRYALACKRNVTVLQRW